MKEIESFRDLHLVAFGNLMQSLAATKRDLEQTRRDVAVCSTTQQQLEKRIEGIQSRVSSPPNQDAVVEALRKEVKLLTQRLASLSESHTKSETRLSETQLHFDGRVTRVLELHTSQIESLRNRIVNPFFDAFRQVVRPELAYKDVLVKEATGRGPASQKNMLFRAKEGTFAIDPDTTSSSAPQDPRMQGLAKRGADIPTQPFTSHSNRDSHSLLQSEQQASSPATDAGAGIKRKRSDSDESGHSFKPLASESSTRGESIKNTIPLSSASTQGNFDSNPAKVPSGRENTDSRSSSEVKARPGAHMPLLRSLQAYKLDPATANSRDSHVAFARLGKSYRLTPLVVTKGFPNSFVSEKLANALLRDGYARQVKANPPPDDVIISMDVSWPCDMGKDHLQPNGLPVCIKAADVHFLVVPAAEAEMKNGIVLGSEVLDKCRLTVVRSPADGRYYLSYEGQSDILALQLLDYPWRLSKSRLHEPFNRLCALADWTSTIKNSWARIALFDQVREFEDAQEELELARTRDAGASPEDAPRLTKTCNAARPTTKTSLQSSEARTGVLPGLADTKYGVASAPARSEDSLQELSGIRPSSPIAPSPATASTLRFGDSFYQSREQRLSKR